MVSKSTRYRLILGLAIFVIFAGGVFLFFIERTTYTYTIVIDGVSQTIKSRHTTVGEILTEESLQIRPEDLVDPPIESEIKKGQIITLQKAKPIFVTQNNEEHTYWTLQESLSRFLSEANIQVRPASTILIDGQPLDINQLEGQALPNTIEIDTLINVSVSDDDFPVRSYVATASTVGQFLDEAGILLHESDEVSPSPASWLTNGQRISIRRANSYHIVVEGSEMEVITHYTKIRQIVAAAGLELNGEDFTVPDLDSSVEDGDEIQLIRVHHAYILEDETIPYATSLIPLEDLEIDHKSLVSPGSTGILRRVHEIRYENNQQVSDTIRAEYYLQFPVDEVIGYGTNIVIRTMDTPDGPIEYWRVVEMRVTSYTAASAGKSPEQPGYGITASGVRAGTGVVAIDPTIVPFRSYLYIPGYGKALAGDTGGAVKGRIIDLGYDEGQLKSWRGFVDVYYLTPVPPIDQINYLLP